MKQQFQQYAQASNLRVGASTQRDHILRYLMLFFSCALLLLMLTVPAISHAEQLWPKINVYKSPSCGCCTKWVKHLEQNGFDVKAYNSNKMPVVKRELGVLAQYQSCHTATVGGYYIEGHVPAADIKRLLSEKPVAAGLAAPGMPMGSPGMEGGRKDPYSVLLVSKEGGQTVYSKN